MLKKLLKQKMLTASLKMSELKSGDKAVIIAVSAEGEVAQRIIDMGLVKGTQFKVVRRAPLGDPLEIKLKGFLLALRVKEAEQISVEKVERKEDPSEKTK